MTDQRYDDPLVRELLTSSPTSIPVVYDPLAPGLPLRNMPWENFEKLCAHMIAASNPKVMQAFRYGSHQQGQGGIDILAILDEAARLLVVECKRVQRVQRGSISKWAEAFLSREDLKAIDEFILAVTDDIDHDRHLIAEWHAAVKRLAELQIRAHFWGFQHIEKVLLDHPRIVARFFGPEAARRFCPAAIPLETWPREYGHRSLSVHANSVVIENRSLRLDLFVPDEDHPRVAAGLSFARSDLRGISLAIEGQAMVTWLQWVAHSPSLQGAPFLPAIPRESRFLLQAPSARLQMTRSEVEDLEWVLREAWGRYFKAAVTVDQRWQASRFPLLDKQSPMFFGLCKVKRWFWRAILAYAHEHDFNNGVSYNHIFDGGAACLKVYVREARAGLEPGYHLIAYGRSDDEGSLSDGGVVIGWQRFPDIGGETPRYSPEAAWDAEVAHQWMMRSLFPAVLKWMADSERSNRSLLGRFIFSSKPVAPTLDSSGAAHSCARTSYSAAALRLTTLAEAVHVSRTLQSHFTVYHSEVPLEAMTIKSVLQLMVRLLPSTKQPDAPYIRGKLGIETPSLIDGVRLLLQGIVQPYTTPGELDMALRSLIAVLECRDKLDEADLNYASMQLEPLWSRWREDWICGVYS